MRFRPVLKNLGDEVKARRVERRLTQEQLAGAAEVDVNTVRRLERAETECQILTLIDVAKGLSMPLAELIAGMERRQALELAAISTL